MTRSPRRFLLILSALSPLMAAGCLTITQPLGVAEINDPPWLAPMDRIPYRAGRVPTPAIEPELHPEPAVESLPESDPVVPVLPQLPAVSTPRNPELTLPPQQGETTAPPLELAVDAPDQKQVGSMASFRLAIRNRGREPVTGVVIQGSFGDGMLIPGSTKKGVRQSLGRLEPGEVKEVALVVRGVLTGEQCAEFALFVEDEEIVWKSVCVDFLPRALDVKVMGPYERRVGHRAELNIKLANLASYSLQNLRLRLAYPPTLKPVDVTQGVKSEEGQLSWSLGELASAEGLQVQAEFECLNPSEQSCVTVRVEGEGIPFEEWEHCLTVNRVEGTLDLRLRDERDPVRVGDEFDLVAEIENLSLQATPKMTFDMTVPGNLRAISATQQSQGKSMELQPEVSEGRLRLELPGLPASGVAELRIRFKALRAGDGLFEAAVSVPDSSNRVVIREPTTVNP